jgi:hypothetical protein
MRQAQVFSNGILAGILSETDDGKYIFIYDDYYLLDTKNRAISRAHKMESEILCYKKCYGTKKLGLYKWICCLPNIPRFLAHPKIIGKAFLNIVRM